jgi:dienelactone hydrolase
MLRQETSGQPSCGYCHGARLGAAAQRRDDFKGALAHYQQYFALVPEPFQDRAASAWILVAVGETHFFMGDQDKAIEH